MAYFSPFQKSSITNQIRLGCSPIFIFKLVYCNNFYKIGDFWLGSESRPTSCNFSVLVQCKLPIAIALTCLTNTFICLQSIGSEVNKTDTLENVLAGEVLRYLQTLQWMNICWRCSFAKNKQRKTQFRTQIFKLNWSLFFGNICTSVYSSWKARNSMIVLWYC